MKFLSVQTKPKNDIFGFIPAAYCGSPRHHISGYPASGWWSCSAATYCIFVQQQPKSHQLENSWVWFIITTCIGDKYFKAKLGTEHLQCHWKGICQYFRLYRCRKLVFVWRFNEC